MCDGFHSGHWRRYVLHYIFSDKQGIHGIFDQEVRLSDKLAAHDGRWTGSHRQRSAGKELSGGNRSDTGNGNYGLKGKDLLFIAGGIGLAPLRSVINYCRDKKRENPDAYGSLHIIYGSRSKDDLVDYQEILDEWSQDCKVDLTIDREQEGWDGHVGFIPNYVKELKPDLNRTVLICGPPIMIKFTLDGLKELGFQEEQVYTTMELRMKCGIGKCGRCNIGDKYVCKDGPVFRFDELSELPNEY